MKYYQKGYDFPPIVDSGNKYSIFDGAHRHRLQAAINLNVPIRAYIGYEINRK